MRRAALLILTVLASVWPASASWTASGVFMYMDREYDRTGFTGVETPEPIREADVEVVDANANGKGSVLTVGATADDGSFSLPVSDNQTRDVYVRVVSRSQNTPSLNIDVRVSAGGKAQYYAAATATVLGHSPAVNVNFGTSVVQIGQGGEAFNLYDQLVRGSDYLAFLTGSRPDSSHSLAVAWDINGGLGDSYYDATSRIIHARDTSGYDDTVLLHEMGHFAMESYSASDTISGTHTFSMCNIDIRLAFEEGWATYWGNSVLRYMGMPDCNIYTRTNGGPGPGHLVRYADLETGGPYYCKGSGSELNVTSLLWDTADGPSTTDTTPGVDESDDPMSLDDHDVWNVMTDQLVGMLNPSLENFWDGWFTPPVANGDLAGMLEISGMVDIEFFEDRYEENDTAATAAHVSADGSLNHATFFSDPDQDGAGAPDVDYYSFDAAAGATYVVETTDLMSGANTYLRIYDSDGVTLLAFNDNRASGDLSSEIDWTAVRSDTYFVQVTHTAGVGNYGSYDLKITGPPSPPPGDSGYTQPPSSGGSTDTTRELLNKPDL